MRLRPAALTLLLATGALAALAMIPAGAGAAKSRTAAKRPVITKVAPMRVRVGARMVIRGRNFSSRRRRNTVIFRASNGRTAFAKPSRASRRKLVLRVPSSAARILGRRPARFKLRVLTRRKFSRFTSRRLSPVLVPSNVAGIDGGPGTSSCLAGDHDGDLLTGAKEAAIGTDPCLADTDRDGVEDGYEWQSSLDLNHYPTNPQLPYPGKRPYPNALDPSDGVTDYDGDGLHLRDEFLLWVRFAADGVRRNGRPGSLAPLLYSEGLQSSRPGTPAPPAGTLARWALDINADGVLHDGERDADGDGLGNWDESHGRMTEPWWPAKHDGINEPKESKYPGINFLDNDDLPGRDAHADPDIDGDGVLDGYDDHDWDGMSNQFEVARPGDWFSQAFPPPGDTPNPWAYVNPFNPCKPFNSERCHQFVPFGYYDADTVPPVGPDPPAGYPTTHPVTPEGY